MIKKIDVPITVKIIDPKAPDMVLFGLKLVNLGPPIVLPTIYPPISEKKHAINKIRIDSSPYSDLILIKRKLNKNKYKITKKNKMIIINLFL